MIKVSDFGLSENLYMENYFKQDTSSGVKLPVKWMAPESLSDAYFSEKSDVVKTEKSIAVNSCNNLNLQIWTPLMRDVS